MRKLFCLICLLPVLAFGGKYYLRYYVDGEGNIMFPIVYTNAIDWSRQMLALGNWTLVQGNYPLQCPDYSAAYAAQKDYTPPQVKTYYAMFAGVNASPVSVLEVDGEHLFLAAYSQSAYSATNLPPFNTYTPCLYWCNWHLYGATSQRLDYCGVIDKTVDDSRIPRGYWATMPPTTHTDTRNESGDLTSWSESGTKPILSSQGELIGVSSGVTGTTLGGGSSTNSSGSVDLSGVTSRLDLIHGSQHDYSSYLVNQAQANSLEVTYLPYLYDIVHAPKKDYSADLAAIKTAVDNKPVPSLDSASIVSSVNNGNTLLARVADGVDSVKSTLNASVGVNVGSELPADDPIDYSELTQAKDQVQTWGVGLDDSWGWLNTGLDRFFGSVPSVGTATDGGSFDFGIAGFTFRLDFSKFAAFAGWFRPCCLYALLIGWAFSAVAIVRGAFV